MTVTTETGGSAPAEGQLVTVRNRIWVVSDVARSTIAPQSMTGRPQHAVTLVSIEDNARDEHLRVVWELERGAVPTTSTCCPIRLRASTTRASSMPSWTRSDGPHRPRHCPTAGGSRRDRRGRPRGLRPGRRHPLPAARHPVLTTSRASPVGGNGRQSA